MDSERFEDLKSLLPTPEALKQFRMAPIDFEKVADKSSLFVALYRFCVFMYAGLTVFYY